MNKSILMSPNSPFVCLFYNEENYFASGSSYAEQPPVRVAARRRHHIGWSQARSLRIVSAAGRRNVTNSTASCENFFFFFLHRVLLFLMQFKDFTDDFWKRWGFLKGAIHTSVISRPSSGLSPPWSRYDDGEVSLIWAAHSIKKTTFKLINRRK